MAAPLNLFNTALERLRSGDVVAIPTETVYGLAASIASDKGIDKIFSVKERPFFDPLIVHLADIKQVELVAAEFPPLAKKLAENFWPGPLTLILPKRKDLNPKITSGLNTVGVRIPRNEQTRKLIRELGSPVAAPSANKFGRTSPTSAAHVTSEFGNIVLTLDGGDCEVGVESTVAGFSQDFSEIHVYRPGAITTEMLSKFAPTKLMSNPAAPGQLKHHYMPDIPLVVLSTQNSLTPDLYLQLATELGAQALYPSWMTLPEDPVQAARLLYAKMRTAGEKSHSNCIILSYSLNTSSGDVNAAVSDRLQKAARLII